MKKLPLLCLGLVTVAFLLGLLQLFKLRFEAGDIYPPYSTYRADPLGAKALYESLGTLRSTRRNLQPVARLGDGRDTTLLWLGAATDQLRFVSNDFRALDTFVRSGGRLIISCQPILARPRTNFFMGPAFARRGAGPGGVPTNAPTRTRAGPGIAAWDDPRTERLEARWGFTTQFQDLARSDAGKYQPAEAALQDVPASPALPATIKAWTAMGFTASDPAWRILYARGTGSNLVSIILERDLGRGTVTLSADSYYFSNEALRDDRQPGLLAWFAGASREVVFEETHLGVSEGPGIASLARQYGLQTFLGAVLVLAALFIWKNSVGFMPPYEQQQAVDEGEIVEGKDSASGFVNLLRRHIAPAHLLRVCLEQWNAQVARARRPSRDKLEAMQRWIDAENALDPRRRDPVGTYREFCRILSKRSGFQVPSSELARKATPGKTQSSSSA